MKLKIVLLFLTLFLLAVSCLAQQPVPTPPDEAPIKVLTNEVHLNVTARDESGGFVSDLKASDLLVVEEGTPQDISKVEKFPANILLLLDTGSDLNFAKTVKNTQLAAEIFVRSLEPDNALSVMQYSDKIETLAGWSNDYQPAIQAINSRIFPGRKSRLSDAIKAAVESLKTRPLENRQLVLVTDGIESGNDLKAYDEALQNLLAANITVHIISYTKLEEDKAEKAMRNFNFGDGKSHPHIDPLIYDQILKGMAMGMSGRFGGDGRDAARLRDRLKALNENPPYVIIKFDAPRKKLIEEKRRAWKTGETKLEALTTETGGIFQAPEELITIFKLSGEIAKAVSSQFVITYESKNTYENPAANQNRKVRVSTHCSGVEIFSRQNITVLTGSGVKSDK